MRRVDFAAAQLRAALDTGDAAAVRAASDAASLLLGTMRPSAATAELERLVLEAHPSPFASRAEALRHF